VLVGHGYAVKRLKSHPHAPGIVASVSYDMTVTQGLTTRDAAMVFRVICFSFFFERFCAIARHLLFTSSK